MIDGVDEHDGQELATGDHVRVLKLVTETPHYNAAQAMTALRSFDLSASRLITTPQRTTAPTVLD